MMGEVMFSDNFSALMASLGRRLYPIFNKMVLLSTRTWLSWKCPTILFHSQNMKLHFLEISSCFKFQRHLPSTTHLLVQFLIWLLIRAYVGRSPLFHISYFFWIHLSDGRFNISPVQYTPRQTIVTYSDSFQQYHLYDSTTHCHSYL